MIPLGRQVFKMFLMTGVSASALQSSASFAVCDPTLEVVEIAISQMAFAPAELEICVGQTVRWTNLEPADVPRPVKHTVTADPALARIPGNVVLPEGADTFDSGVLSPTQTFEHTFTVPGEYKYICRPHEAMGHLGKLWVVEPPSL